MVEEFYNSDDCFRPNPGMRGVIFLKKKTEEKELTSKRFMTYSGGESQQLFLEKNPDHKLSLSKF